MEKHSLLDEKSIQAWIAEHDPYGMEKLWEEVEGGRITGARARTVGVFLKKKAAQAQMQADAEQVSREGRSVRAAEISAQWAKFSGVISMLALIISLIAIFKPL